MAMKRLLLALILLLPRLVSAQTEGELRVQRGGTCERPVMAMNRDSLGLDTLRRIDTVGNDREVSGLKAIVWFTLS